MASQRPIGFYRVVESVLFHKHFRYIVALATDVDAGRGVGHTQAIEIVVFNGSVGVLFNRNILHARGCARRFGSRTIDL